MARYYQRPNNPIVDLTPKVPIEFYSNLMNQAQQNLNQANATGAAFMTDAHNQKFVDQAARDRAMALGQAPIEQALDRDFVTPAAIAKAVSQASAAMADWKNANAKHVELVKNYEEDKRRLGLNFLGTDPTKISLLKGDSFLTPEELKYTSMNAEDVYKTFGQTYGANLLGVTDNLVASDIPFKYKLEKIKGLSKEQKLQLLSPGTKDAVELAAGMMATNPNLRQGLMDIYGNEEAAMKALQDLNLRASMDDKYAQTKDISYMDDDWSLYMAKKRAENPPPQQERLFYPTEGGIVENPIASQGMGQIMANLTGSTTMVDWEGIEGNYFNSQGNMVTSVGGYPSGAGGRSHKINNQYKEARIQLDKYKELSGNKNMTDRQALDMMKSAAANSAQFYSLTDDALSDLYTGNNLNPFSDINRGVKDFKTFSPEFYNTTTGKWEPVSYDELAKKVGFKGDDKKALSDQLRDGSTKTFNYSSGEPKLVSNIKGGDGLDYTLRYNPGNSEVTRISKPYAKVQQSLITPGDHTLSFNNIRVKYKTVPTQVTNEYGVPKVVNKIVGLQVTHGINGDYANRQTNDQIIQVLEQSQTPEEHLMYFTRLYRDEQLVNRAHVFKSTKPKE